MTQLTVGGTLIRIHPGSEGAYRVGGHGGLLPEPAHRLLEFAGVPLHEAGGVEGEGRNATAPDPGAAKDLAEFIGLLGELRVWAGTPSYRALAKQAGPLMQPARVVSPFMVVDAFKADRSRLEPDLVTAIVRALGTDEAGAARWREACARLQGMAARTGGTAGVQKGRGVAELAPGAGAAAYPDRVAGPSAVERKLLGLLAEGLTDVTIAKRLNVSLRTERRMVADVMRRLGASGRFEAGVKAVRRRWI